MYLKQLKKNTLPFKMFYINKDDKYRPSSPQAMTAALPKKILHVSAKCLVRIQHKSLDSNALRTFDFVLVVVVLVVNVSNL